MNLEDLKKRVRAVTKYEWCGESVYLRKLSAQDHLDIFARIQTEAEKKLDPEADKDATLNFHVTVVAKSLADEAGELIADSEDGRKALAGLGFDDLVSLGELVLKHSGYGDEKKS